MTGLGDNARLVVDTPSRRKRWTLMCLAQIRVSTRKESSKQKLTFLSSTIAAPQSCQCARIRARSASAWWLSSGTRAARNFIRKQGGRDDGEVGWGLEGQPRCSSSKKSRKDVWSGLIGLCSIMLSGNDPTGMHSMMSSIPVCRRKSAGTRKASDNGSTVTGLQ